VTKTAQPPADATDAHVSVEVRDRVGVVWLDRPDERNAYTPTMARQLASALRDLDADDQVRVIVVTGRGSDFCVGADLDIDWRAPEVHGVETVTDPDHLPWKLATPIIAALNGACIGVALTWALQFDIRVVGDDVRLAVPFNRIGVIPDRNSLWLLSRLIGHSRAMDLLLTGRTFGADEAVSMGLASRSVPAAETLDTALKIADDIATKCSPASTTATKVLAYEFLETNDRMRAYHMERRVLNWVRTLGETARGVVAFRERRPPEWGSSKHDRPPWELR
jgi:enoyl-CoA hydratase/carnithine racemase